MLAVKFLYAIFIGLVGIVQAESSVLLDVTPMTLKPGLTDTMIVNCSFSFDVPSNMSSLMSLTISKSENRTSSLSDFHDVVSVDTFSQGNVTELSTTNASVSSHISGGDNSFLSLTWAYPSEAEGGVYKCSATGMDSTGHPLSLEAKSTVSIGDVGKDQLINEIKQNRLKFENLEQKFEILENTFETTIKNLTSKVSELELSLSVSETFQKDRMLYTNFTRRGSYKNHTYFSSKSWTMKFGIAQRTCQVIGGYLAEVNDQDEQDYMSQRFPGSLFAGLLGMTDKGHKGSWEYMSNKSPVPYDIWEGNPPNDTGKDCACYFGAKIISWNCDEPFFIICEVPNV